MKDIVIIGAGGFGREVVQLIEDINTDIKTWNLLGFIDETVGKQETFINDIPVLGNLEWFEKANKSNLYTVCAIGNPKDKYNLISRASDYDINFANLIHPNAKVSKYTEFGIDCIICNNTFISVNTKIGNHISINPGCGIGHDTIIKDYSTIYWNVILSGNVCINEGCELGSKADVLPKMTVGKWSIIGAGAVVTCDIPDNCTAVGVPAKEIKITERTDYMNQSFNDEVNSYFDIDDEEGEICITCHENESETILVEIEDEMPIIEPKEKEISDSKIPPFINFVTFNRLGLTVKNLSKILESKEDFEMHIIDCNSKDNSWDYIQSLTDSRIKSKTRFEKNYGPIYPLNYALTKRKPNQYFFTIDSDTYIKTENWIQRFMDVFEAFPEVGVLGLMRDNPYPRFMPPVIPKVKDDISYLELKNAKLGEIMDFIPGQLQCLRPELIEKIGYWSEECGYGDAELSPRVTHYTDFKVGFLTTIEIDMTQHVGCNECMGIAFCKLSKSIGSCYTISKKSNQNESFVKKFEWKYYEVFKELEEGKRTVYCASLHDPNSTENHLYHKDWAEENFNYYLQNSN